MRNHSKGTIKHEGTFLTHVMFFYGSEMILDYATLKPVLNCILLLMYRGVGVCQCLSSVRVFNKYLTSHRLGVSILLSLKDHVPRHVLPQIYTFLVHSPTHPYSDPYWPTHGLVRAAPTDKIKLAPFQAKILWPSLNVPWFVMNSKIHRELGIPPLHKQMLRVCQTNY